MDSCADPRLAHVTSQRSESNRLAAGLAHLCCGGAFRQCICVMLCASLLSRDNPPGRFASIKLAARINLRHSWHKLEEDS